ncbi:MAG: hypothetical protein WCF90_09300 [Methanomicrobiales archaeon]
MTPDIVEWTIKAVEKCGITVINAVDGNKVMVVKKRITPRDDEVMAGSSITFIVIGFEEHAYGWKDMWTLLHTGINAENDAIRRPNCKLFLSRV